MPARGDEPDEAEGEAGQRRRFGDLDGGRQVAHHLRVLSDAVRIAHVH